MADFVPNRIKRATGNPGKRALNTPPDVTPGAPTCPSTLPAAAKAEWRRIVPLLDEYNLLTRLDGRALADYCLCCARLDEAEQDITTRGLLIQGERGLVKNPNAQIARQYRQALVKWAELFGLSPGPRGRLNCEPPVSNREELLKLLRQPRTPRTGPV